MIGYRIELTHPFNPRKRILATVRPEALAVGLLFQRGERLSQVWPILAPQRVTAVYHVGNTEYQALKRGNAR